MIRSLLFLLLLFSASAQALTVDLRWVESDVSLRPDGRAEVLYRINYRVTSGEMHGFYFQGTAGSPISTCRTASPSPRTAAASGSRWRSSPWGAASMTYCWKKGEATDRAS